MNNNQIYIEKYKDEDKIIESYYKENNIVVDGIVNPLSLDFRSLCAPTDQQDNKPHCSAYSICNIFESYYWKSTGKLINLDADQVYAKAKEKDYFIDSPGISLEQAIKSCWTLCGFENNPEVCILKNNHDKNTIEQFKFLIHKYLFVHTGLKITTSWTDCINDGSWWKPTKYIINENKDFIGQHAVVCCGYNKNGVIVQNSWGKSFGDKGFCIVPYNEFLRELRYCCCIKNIYSNFKKV